MEIDPLPPFSSPSEDAADELLATESWTPTVTDSDRFWHQRLTEELQPVVDSLSRLRERDLLD